MNRTGTLIIAGFIVGFVVSSVLFRVSAAHADYQIPVRDLGKFSSTNDDNIDVIKFVDTDNGNVCYLSSGYEAGGISCIKG